MFLSFRDSFHYVTFGDVSLWFILPLLCSGINSVLTGVYTSNWLSHITTGKKQQQQQQKTMYKQPKTEKEYIYQRHQ